MTKVLIIDDDPNIRFLFRDLLEAMGHQGVEVESGEQGIGLVKEEEFDLILLDFNMNGMNGIETLRHIKKISPLTPIVLVTGEEDAEIAIQSMQLGAYDYLSKPVKHSVLIKLVEEAAEVKKLQIEVNFAEALTTSPTQECIVGQSPAMIDLYKRIGKVAPSNATVLITGESGTGKELVARAIYQHSQRANQIFLAVNCAALPETLLESTLFGHEKGAFTGAYQRQIGKFEQADGGTLFLDEIGEMSPTLQAKVLRLIQEKTFERLGGRNLLHCDVRVITATNSNLLEEIENGHFREDLYYRINVVHLHLPPLRERKKDIPQLCNYLLDKVAIEIDKPIPLLTTEVLDVFQNYDWPGNVRELRNVLASAIVNSPTPIILPEHLTISGLKTKDRQSENQSLYGSYTEEQLNQMDDGIFDRVVGELEHHLIEYALKRTGGNQVQSSRILGISRSMLRDRIQRLGISNDIPDV